MLSSSSLLDLIHQSSHLAELLADTFEFDISRGDQCGTARLSSAQSLERLAGDYAGGTFYLCGSPETVRPVLYASSEGQAGLIADSFGEALEIVVGLPYWQDCLKYSGGGDLEVMKSAAQYLLRDMVEKTPEVIYQQSQVAEALSLDIARTEVLLSRLQAAVARSADGYVFTDETGEYDGLFGPFWPARNPLWR